MSYFIEIKKDKINTDIDDINILLDEELLDKLYRLDDVGNIYLTLNRKVLKEILESN